jgi:hypothetical protein
MGIECKSLGKIGGAVRWSVAVRKTLAASPECPASPDSIPKTGAEQDIRTFRTSQRELSPAQVADDDCEVL